MASIVVKGEHKEKAERMFPGIQITDVGHMYLGSFIGTEERKHRFSIGKLMNGLMILNLKIFQILPKGNPRLLILPLTMGYRNDGTMFVEPHLA